MRSVAKRSFRCLLARTPRDHAVGVDFDFERAKSTPLVRSIAKRLAVAQAAGAPIIGARLHFEPNIALLGDVSFLVHRGVLTGHGTN